MQGLSATLIFYVLYYYARLSVTGETNLELRLQPLEPPTPNFFPCVPGPV